MDVALLDKIKEIIDDPEKFEQVAGLLNAAEQERRERQRQGISRAQANGVRFGRPPAPVPQEFPSIYQRYRSGALTGKEAQTLLNINKYAFYRLVKKFKQLEQQLEPDQPEEP